MPKCLLCNKDFAMITESHMNKHHQITCKEYSVAFGIKKGQLNPEHSAKMNSVGNPRYGKAVLPETRLKIKTVHKNSRRFEGKGNPMFGKTHTLEVRKRLSEHYTGKMDGANNPFFGKKHTEKTKRAISNIRIEKGLAKGSKNPLFGKGHTSATKQKISILKKEFFEKYPEKHINSIIAKNYKEQKNKRGGYISKKQIEIYEIIQEKYTDSKLNHPIKTTKGLYFADVGIPSKLIDVEYDGSYWHKNQSNDDQRDNNITAHGWKVIRIKDEQVKKMNKNELKNYILNRIQNNFEEKEII